MSRGVIVRDELFGATLALGGEPIDLTDYATTGLRVVAVGPSGSGKTNAGLLIAEQLAEQGWVCVLVDPEGEIASLYGEPVADATALAEALTLRDRPILVVSARDATEFLPYGEAIFEAADKHRKPIFLMVDEGQVFSDARKRKGDVGAASDLINDLAGRGRKRKIDLFLTSLRYASSLHRSVYSMANLTLVGTQSDPMAWSGLAPQFRGHKITYSDLAALAPGEFYCFSRRGLDKCRMPMADALKAVAPQAPLVRPALPQTFGQWNQAMSAIPTERLGALSRPITALLSAIAGLSDQQQMSGQRALRDEMESRA